MSQIKFKRTSFSLGILLIGFLILSCSSNSSQEANNNTDGNSSSESASSSQSSGEIDEKAMLEKGLGVGPVKEVKLGEEIDKEMVKEGKKIYDQNCTACHQPDKDFIGPSPVGVLDRRKPEWIMNMILNPREMVQKDSTAQKLQSEYNSVMSQQINDREKARKILEYFRTLEK